MACDGAHVAIVDLETDREVAAVPIGGAPDVGGGVKIVYDLALYAGFRARRAEHEAPAG